MQYLSNAYANSLKTTPIRVFTYAALNLYLGNQS